MAFHILLERAKRRTVRSLPQCPEERFHYDLLVGAWVDASGALLVERHDSPTMKTKKGDIETGEDEKGE